MPPASYLKFTFRIFTENRFFQHNFQQVHNTYIPHQVSYECYAPVPLIVSFASTKQEEVFMSDQHCFKGPKLSHFHYENDSVGRDGSYLFPHEKALQEATEAALEMNKAHIT